MLLVSRSAAIGSFPTGWADARLAESGKRHLFPSLENQNMSKRRLEFVGGSSAKFYEVTVEGNDVTICFGRLGTGGQTQSKTFPDNLAAAKHADKLIHEKLAKGYVHR